MSPTKRIGKWTLAFKWCAIAFTALVTVIVLHWLVSDRDTVQVARIPAHFLPVAEKAIPVTVSNVTVELWLVALGVIVVGQILLYGLTDLGSRQLLFPVVAEVLLWVGFSVAVYGMLRGYRADMTCSGPPTHCVVTYPSVLPALGVGLMAGILSGSAWRLSWKADERSSRRNHTATEVSPGVVL